MKWIVWMLVVTLGTLCGYGCGPDAEEGTFTVEGQVVRDGAPVEGVQAAIDDYENLRDETGPDGNFRITGVPSGEHELVLQQIGEDESFTTRSLNLLVAGNVSLEALKLPEPVRLEPLSNITSATLDLTWTESTADDFREYKVYRGESSGLDETTGELVHVATDVTETTFTDTELQPNETYYYRVFVLNEFGQIGGSNIESATTADREFLRNPGFEVISEGFAEDWTRLGNPETVITVSDTVAASGTHSVVFELPDSFEYWVQQDVSTRDLEVGDRLVLTGKMRSDRAQPAVDASVIVNSEFYPIATPASADTWTDFEAEVLVPDTATMRVGVHFIGPMNSVTTTVWVDDLSLRRVP